MSPPTEPAAESAEERRGTSSRLELSPEHLDHIHTHARRTYAEECCGVLMGRLLPDDGGGVVERAVALDNERSDSRHNRYLIEPETVLHAHRQAREAGLDIVGYYHSHPDHPAVPSDFDREHAWPGMSYLITAVEKGRIADTRSWRLIDDRSRFDEERLEIREAEPQDPGERAPADQPSPATATANAQEVAE